MLVGLVIMWRSLVVGSTTRNARKAAMWTIQELRWTVAAADSGISDERGNPTTDQRSNEGVRRG